MKKGIFKKGILDENPVFRLLLGTCPTLAITTMASNAIGMGIAFTFVLLGSNIVISLTRKIIPDKVRIPAYITIIAGFVSIVQMLVKAYVPAVDKSLGIYLPLITVNCIILARAEAFANRNKLIPSILDALGMGVGFTAALLAMGSIREILGNGTWFGLDIGKGIVKPMLIFSMPPGGFFVYGMLIALANKLSFSGKKEKTNADSLACAGCPSEGHCS